MFTGEATVAPGAGMHIVTDGLVALKVQGAAKADVDISARTTRARKGTSRFNMEISAEGDGNSVSG
jgi:hypothetical protein